MNDFIASLEPVSTGGQKCRTCAFIVTQPDADQINEAVADQSVGTKPIYDALVKRGFTFTYSAFAKHRANHA